MAEIVWEAPPAPMTPGRKRLWEGRLAPLRDRPGQWARVDSYSSHAAAGTHRANLRSGRIAGIDPAEWEFTARKTDDGSALYARYIGGES